MRKEASENGASFLFWKTEMYRIDIPRISRYDKNKMKIEVRDMDKNLIGGSTVLMLLALLEEKDCYGYEIIKELKERSQNYTSSCLRRRCNRSAYSTFRSSKLLQRAELYFREKCNTGTHKSRCLLHCRELLQR